MKYNCMTSNNAYASNRNTKLGKFSSTARETAFSRHNGGAIKPANTIVLGGPRCFRGSINWAPMMPRHARIVILLIAVTFPALPKQIRTWRNIYIHIIESAGHPPSLSIVLLFGAFRKY